MSIRTRAEYAVQCGCCGARLRDKGAGSAPRTHWRQTRHSHFREGGMDRGRADLDGDGGIEGGDGRLERLEGEVLVGEDTELGAIVDTEGDTRGKVVLVGTKPGVALGLFKDVVEECVVAVVVHGDADARPWVEGLAGDEGVGGGVGLIGRQGGGCKGGRATTELGRTKGRTWRAIKRKDELVSSCD